MLNREFFKWMLSARQGSGKGEGKIVTDILSNVTSTSIYLKQMAFILWLWVLVSYGLSILFCFLLNEVDQANYDGWKWKGVLFIT